MSTSKNSLGKRISTLRKKKKISQQELAKAIGVSNQLISMYERDKRQPKIDKIITLADYFNVPVLYLQGLSDNKWNDSLDELNDNTKKSLLSALQTIDHALSELPIDKKTSKEQQKEASIAIQSITNKLIRYGDYKLLQKYSTILVAVANTILLKEKLSEAEIKDAKNALNDLLS